MNLTGKYLSNLTTKSFWHRADGAVQPLQHSVGVDRVVGQREDTQRRALQRHVDNVHPLVKENELLLGLVAFAGRSSMGLVHHLLQLVLTAVEQ